MNLKEETINLFGYEFKIVMSDEIPKNEIWVKDKNTIHKIVNLEDWQVIASGEVKGKYQVYIGDKSIYNIENKLIDYNGKNIEIAVRVKG